MRIIALFNLKPGVTATDFEDWAKARNLPVVRAQPSVEEFQFYRTTGVMGGDGTAPYAYVQLIDVPDMEGFDKDSASEAMQAVKDELGERVETPVFMTTEALTLV